MRDASALEWRTSAPEAVNCSSWRDMACGSLSVPHMETRQGQLSAICAGNIPCLVDSRYQLRRRVRVSAVPQHHVQNYHAYLRVGGLLQQTATSRAEINHGMRTPHGVAVVSKVDYRVALAHIRVGKRLHSIESQVGMKLQTAPLQRPQRLIAQRSAGKEATDVSFSIGQAVSYALHTFPQVGRDGSPMLGGLLTCYVQYPARSSFQGRLDIDIWAIILRFSAEEREHTWLGGALEGGRQAAHSFSSGRFGYEGPRPRWIHHPVAGAGTPAS